MKRAGGLLIAAAALTLVIGYALRATPGYVMADADGSVMGDITHYVFWTRLVTLGGMQAAYSGAWPETYAVYPPVTLYAYQAVGSVYRWSQDPSFDTDRAQQSLWLRAGIKYVALAFHLLTAGAIFWLVGRRLTAPSRAALASGLYLLNPATLYDVAHWGQPDGAHSLFSVLAVGLLDMSQVVAPWAALAVAALAKPQAWAIVPLILVATWRAHGRCGIVRGVGGAVAASVLISLPFIVTGRLPELLSLPRTLASVMPVVSADAHNVWWLVFQARGQDPLFTPDQARLLGPFTYRMVAGALVAGSLLVTYWLYWTRRASLAEAAALGVLGWFCFTTQAHENHLFFALPLLSLAWPARTWLLAPFGVLSMTLLLNMLLQDITVLDRLGIGPDDVSLQSLRFLNAITNLLCYAGWAARAAWRLPGSATDSATVRYWPSHPAGVAAGGSS